MPRIDHDIHNFEYSPDGGSVAFDVPAERTIFITPSHNGIGGGRSEWIRIGEGEHPWWSPDGRMLYFLSRRDGFECLWAQRLSAGTKRPTGENFAAQHFHGRVFYEIEAAASRNPDRPLYRR